MSNRQPSRREFGLFAGSLALSAPFLAAPGQSAANDRFGSDETLNIPLGFDNFSIRALNWKADRLLEFAIEQKLDSILFSDLDVYENHEEAYLKSLAAKAADHDISIQAGTGGICPTSRRFNDKWGSAQEHLQLCLRIASAVNSNVVRCYLGSQDDRQGDGGIQRHIDATVEVLDQIKSQAVDANIKIAVENHAGDMQAWELVGLIRAAGEEFVGATLDSGNATWTLENPLTNLETLGPYAVCTGMRDSTVWEVDEGSKVAWNAIGEGQVNWAQYLARFAELCPNVPFQLEIISGFHKLVPYKQPEFWRMFPSARARDYEAFLALARDGKPLETGAPNDPVFQMEELERSIRYCKQDLGLGLKS